MSCVFHYTESLNQKKDELGLSIQYRQNQVLKSWIRRIVALCMLPPWLVTHVAPDLLANPPWTGDHATDLAIQAFVTYFQGFWMSPALVPLWNCWENAGPRTTNHAEGWHSALRFKFRTRHPGLGEFLAEVQKWHHAYAISGRNLLAGLQQPVPRRPQDVRNDQRIQQAKTPTSIIISEIGKLQVRDQIDRPYLFFWIMFSI
ncbi:MAG: hypothetical protein GY696_16525 [Gammaproteobacteria bacterium]|nr:hypothetical protein [Gammaproteobacteria bacterium]